MVEVRCKVHKPVLGFTFICNLKQFNSTKARWARRHHMFAETFLINVKVLKVMFDVTGTSVCSQCD